MSPIINRQGETLSEEERGQSTTNKKEFIFNAKETNKKSAAFLRTLKLKIRAISLGSVTPLPNTLHKQPPTHALTTQRARAQKKCTRARFKQ